MGRSTFSGPIKSKAGIELNDDADVSLSAAAISGGSNAVEITQAQAVEAIGTFTPSHKVKIKINGVEYWIQLDAV